MADRIHQSRRGFREIPGASVRVRGQNDLPYNPGKPLRLPRDRRPHRPPQLNTGGLMRLLVPVALLTALGVGVFFGVDALLSDGGSGPETPATAADTADTTAPAGSEADDTAAPIDAADTTTPADTTGDTTADVTTDTSTDTAADVSTDTPTDTTGDVPRATGIITPADLGGAPVLLERAAARPVPAGIPDRTLADGGVYDPTDATVVFSSVWEPGTVLEVTRLPGAPLLSEEDAAQLIGKTIRVTVGAQGTFPEELQLTPAAYGLLAQDIEPIIAVRIEVVGAPPE